MSSLFATMRWVGGEDDGHITPGLPTGWIRGFNIDEYNSENYDSDRVFLVEWRETKKEPAGGWKLYEGRVLDVGPSVKVLEKRSRMYDLPMSPKDVFAAKHNSSTTTEKVLESEPCGSGLNNKHETPEPVTKKRRIDSGEGDVLNNPLDNDRIEDQELTPRMTRRTPFRPMNEQQAHDPLNVPGTVRDRVYDNMGDEAVRIEPVRRHEILEIRDLLQSNRDLLRRLEQPQIHEEDPGTVELGHKGSGVRVTKDQWDSAQEQSTFTSMATNLVMSCFDRRVLLKSNVKGGSSKIKTLEENPEKHHALDRDILNAITAAVRIKFPEKFKKSSMHSAINTKLSNLRRTERRAVASQQQTPQREN